jgi:hypothetical protein
MEWVVGRKWLEPPEALKWQEARECQTLVSQMVEWVDPEWVDLLDPEWVDLLDPE